MEGVTEDIIKAQEEAEKEAEKLEQLPDDEVLPSVPKLLDLPKEALVEKTHELKSKGKQLDLLLLKAESYSHFIAENQKRSILTIGSYNRESSESSTSSSSKKRKGEPENASSKRKTRGSSASSSSSVESSPGSVTDAEVAEITFQQPPNLVGGKLLSYQIEGLQWLLSLWENGLSGILADEMGLGKTIQVIGLIAHLRHGNTTGPFLIAAPLATISNWINEFKKWLPSCPVLMYHGTKDERTALRKEKLAISNQKSFNFPVVITSFEICMIDRTFLDKYTWQYLILDEGHRIKNRNCRLSRELKAIRSVSRLLLTGTPIQNTLEELWSLLNFCCPNIFDDLRVFQAWFGFRNIGKETKVDDIIGDEQQERIVTKLHEILRPFLLRRMKKDVLLKMPPKKEIVIYCGMTALQREYYTRAKDHTLRDTLLNMGIEAAKDMSEKNCVMSLRKACNHPFLFGEPKDENGIYLGESNPNILIMASGKFRLLDRMLPQLYAEKHKVLLFSQMTELLNIVEDYLIYRGYKYCRLDGSTKLKDRQIGIDRFNNDPEIFIFLLSTRAGGLGINLTAADTCIIYDSDWNPHQDSQAQDRCHRIGQNKPVVVYRYLTVESIEISMMEKQISKKKLERLTIHGGDYRKAGKRASTSLTINKLRRLLEDDVKNLTRKSLNPPPNNSINTMMNHLLMESNTNLNGSSTNGKQAKPSDSSSGKNISQRQSSTTVKSKDTIHIKSEEAEDKVRDNVENDEDDEYIVGGEVNNTIDSSEIEHTIGFVPTYVEISEDELSAIMNRTRLFVPSTIRGSSGVGVRTPSPTGISDVPSSEDIQGTCTDPSADSPTTKGKKSTTTSKRSTKSTSPVQSSKDSAPVSSTTVPAAGSKDPHDMVGNASEDNVVYSVDPTIPLEGYMYDIVTIDPTSIGNVLQGINC